MKNLFLTLSISILFLNSGCSTTSHLADHQAHGDKRTPSSVENTCEGANLERRVEAFVNDKMDLSIQSIEFSHPESIAMNAILATKAILPFLSSGQDATIKEAHIQTSAKDLKLNCHVLCDRNTIALNSCVIYNDSRAGIKQIR